MVNPATTLILRLEGGVALGVSVAAYNALGGGWLMFVLVCLVPDVSMLGYLRNPRIGAVVYNAAHTYLAPAVLALAGFAAGPPLLYRLALIWVAHIGFDRLLGYGLKASTGFGDTHLGRLGNRQVRTAALRP